MRSRQPVTSLPDVVVVKEAKGVTHLRYGLLLALVVGGLGSLMLFAIPDDGPPENKMIGFVLVGVMSALLIARWIYEALHPEFLEISYEAIVASRRGRHAKQVIQRTTGEFVFGIGTAGPKSVYPYIAALGDEENHIGLSSFDRSTVKEACEAVGWRFVEN